VKSNTSKLMLDHVINQDPRRYSLAEAMRLFSILPREAFLMGVTEEDSSPFLLNVQDSSILNIRIKAGTFDFKSLIKLNSVTGNEIDVCYVKKGMDKKLIADTVYAIARWIYKRKSTSLVVIFEDLREIVSNTANHIDMRYILGRMRWTLGHLPVKVIALYDEDLDTEWQDYFNITLTSTDKPNTYIFEEGKPKRKYNFYVPQD